MAGPPSAAPALLGGEAELLDAVPHLVAIDAEELPRLRLIPAGSLERLDKQLPFDLVEADALGRQFEFGGRDRSCQRREVTWLEPLVLDEQHRPLDRVAHLADVARP